MIPLAVKAHLIRHMLDMREKHMKMDLGTNTILTPNVYHAIWESGVKLVINVLEPYFDDK